MPLDLAYTLCFIVHDDHVLLMHRARAPHRDRWNGLGGKIDPDETPREGIVREIHEEAGITFPADAFAWRGMVTWNLWPRSEQEQGLHLFVTQLGAPLPGGHVFPETHEGALRWQPIAWADDLTNAAMADNVPFFLRRILTDETPIHVQCHYEDDTLHNVTFAVLDRRIVDPDVVRTDVKGR